MMSRESPRVDYDERTALIVVDTQNDFADPEGSLYVEDGEMIIPGVNEEIAAARDAGALVVYTQDSHPASTPHFRKDGGIWPVHCVEGTWGWELHPSLDSTGPVVKKGVDGGDGYSGFSVRDPESGDEEDTELGRLLDDHDIERVVVVGLAQDYCVKETVVDAAHRGYDATLLTDLTRPVDMEPGDGEAALEDVEEAGATLV